MKKEHRTRLWYEPSGTRAVRVMACTQLLPMGAGISFSSSKIRPRTSGWPGQHPGRRPSNTSRGRSISPSAFNTKHLSALLLKYPLTGFQPNAQENASRLQGSCGRLIMRKTKSPDRVPYIFSGEYYAKSEMPSQAVLSKKIWGPLQGVPFAFLL